MRVGSYIAALPESQDLPGLDPGLVGSSHKKPEGLGECQVFSFAEQSDMSQPLTLPILTESHQTNRKMKRHER